MPDDTSDDQTRTGDGDVHQLVEMPDVEISVDEVDSWERCPRGHTQIEGGSVTIEGESAWQHVACLVCNLTWVEIYEASTRRFAHESCPHPGLTLYQSERMAYYRVEWVPLADEDRDDERVVRAVSIDWEKQEQTDTYDVALQCDLCGETLVRGEDFNDITDAS